MGTTDNDGSPSASSRLKRIHSLFREGKFNEALPLAQKLVADFPDDSQFPVTLSLCYSEAQEPQKALKILTKAAEKFPADHNILFHIAGVHEQMDDYEKSETYYRQALEHTPAEMNVERSECYNGIGVALWHSHRRDEAITMWRQAVHEDPANETAKQNLQDFSNEYGSGKAPSPLLDDVYQFQKVQLEKYEGTRRKDMPPSEAELREILGAIMRTWNEKIAPLGEKLDRMTAAEKTEFFKMTNCDFSQPWKTPVIPLNPPSGHKRRKSSKQEPEFGDVLNDRFAFLGQLAGPILFLYGIPALLSVGLRERRLAEILSGSKITAQEKRLFAWVYDVVAATLLARDSKQGRTDLEGILDAYDLARRKLNHRSARELLMRTLKLIDEPGRKPGRK